MPRIGITGHARLSTGTNALVLDAVTEELRGYAGPDLHGITCLAEGADQLFARAVLALHGTFEVVLPARDYREQVDCGALAAFDELLDKAAAVRTMPFERSSRHAYLAASTDMLSRCELLFAVWDGGPSLGLGDTAHVVATARSRHIPVKVLWPAGSGRVRPPKIGRPWPLP